MSDDHKNEDDDDDDNNDNNNKNITDFRPCTWPFSILSNN